MAMYCKTHNKKNSDKGQQIQGKDNVKVFCRIRSLENKNDISCIKFISNKTVSLTPPATSVGSQRRNYRELHCTFHHVFDENAAQETIFEDTTLPLINEVLKGRNCLLFAYGLSGSGKTYTMIGEPQNTGIIPRSLDVIFNNIMHLQAEKFVFKPDKMNGFEVQSEENAWKERQREIAAYMKSARPQRFVKMDDSTEYDQQTSHSVQLENINKDSIYAIFVSCIEIYNNMVYDLLEHTLDYGKSKLPQRKLVREDSAHNMYVHDAVEVEVKSSKEACKIFYKGMHRKHTTFTSLNSDSNRSHSVFTIRVVQAVLNRSGGAPEQKQAFCVSQLCLVDLAGSKRTSHTKKTGQRLMESGIINNSLMTLKSCFKTLQENQMLGTKKLVSYRDSKLTYLFKNFFEGESCVHALVCVNPKAADFDENMQVMKLAESVKEVQVLHPSSAVRNLGFPVGRKRANHILQAALQKLEQDNQEHSSEEISSLSSTFPCLEMKDPMDDKLINELVVLLEHRNEQYRLLRQDWVHEEKEFRNQLEEVMRTNVLVVQESTRLRDIRDFQKNKRLTLEAKVNEMCLCVQRLQQELHSKNKAINMVKLELEEKKRQLCYLILENKQTAHICVAKLPAETHTGACNIQVPLSKQEDKVKITAKEKTKSHTKVKHALMDDIHYTSSSSERNLSHTEHKSAEVVMHANINELQNAELSGVASLHSVQHHAQALTTEPSGKTLKANVVTVAQNGMENLSKYSAFTSLPRRRSIASPVTLAEDKSNTSVVA